MNYGRMFVPLAATLLIAPLSALANDYGVFSAAGELPNQRMARLAEQRSMENASRLGTTNRERETLRQMPPPLPSGGTEPRSLAQPMANVNTSAPLHANNSGGVAPAPAQQSQAPGEPARSFNRDLDAVMGESVTIDVQDMRWEQIITSIMPTGWRVRFQRVGDSILAQRADVTITNATRKDVLHTLLSRAGLAMEPFPEFDVPLLIVSKQNGAQ